jgi:N-acetylmuramic acid 6-phosphate etherase
VKESVFQELAGLSTESRNPDTQNLDTMTTREILEAMNREDRKVPEVLAAAIPQIEQVVERVVQALSKGGRLLYIGAGTSGRLGVLDAAECPPTFGTDPWQVQGFIAGGYDALVRAVEGAEDNPDGVLHDYEMCCINEEDVVVGITASRRTPFVLGGLRHAKAHGCFTALLICNEPPTESMIYEASVDAGLGALAREGGNSVVEKGWVAEETPPNPPVNGGGSEAPLNPPISADVNGGGIGRDPP